MDTPSISFHDKEIITQKALELGFSACSFASVDIIDAEAQLYFHNWIEEEKHNGMDYLENYSDIRINPELLLEGAKSIICVALNYYPSVFQSAEAPQFAYYAYGKDYHDVVRKKLQDLALFLQDNFGATSRVCVDTAPIRERYWAQKSGLGFIGRNNQLIIPGKGSYFFLGELVTTLNIEPDKSINVNCGSCKACLEACPTQSLSESGALDARKCLSCLTIEHRGEFTSPINLGNRIYGCDDCQKCCPHNRFATPNNTPELQPSPKFLSLTRKDIEDMTQVKFSELFSRSAIKRTKLAGLQRNLRYLDDEK